MYKLCSKPSHLVFVFTFRYFKFYDILRKLNKKQILSLLFQQLFPDSQIPSHQREYGTFDNSFQHGYTIYSWSAFAQTSHSNPQITRCANLPTILHVVVHVLCQYLFGFPRISYLLCFLSNNCIRYIIFIWVLWFIRLKNRSFVIIVMNHFICLVCLWIVIILYRRYHINY